MSANLLENLRKIKECFYSLDIDYIEPYESTVGKIASKENGNHRGLYYIYPEKNFYFGLSGKSKTATISSGRMNTHILKLRVDLSSLYGPENEKCQPSKTFPQGWKYAVRKHIINEKTKIPSHWIAMIPPEGKKKWVKPGCLNYPVTYQKTISPEGLKVLVWDLNHLSPKAIKSIEKRVIKSIWPEANSETYNKKYKKIDL